MITEGAGLPVHMLHLGPVRTRR